MSLYFRVGNRDRSWYVALIELLLAADINHNQVSTSIQFLLQLFQTDARHIGIFTLYRSRGGRLP